MRNIRRLLISTACVAALALPAQAQVSDLRGWETTPGLYLYLVQSTGFWGENLLSGEHRPVRDRVGGHAGLEMTFRPGLPPAPKTLGDLPFRSTRIIEDVPAIFVYRPPAPVFGSRDPWAGFCLWVKGDGSDGVGIIGIGEGAPNDPRVTFYLREKTWQPVRVRWEDFNPAFRSTSVASLFFTVSPGTKRPARYVVSRLELIRAVGATREDDALRAAGAKAAKEPDVERPKDLAAFVSGRERFAAFRAKLDAKKPAHVLVIGDAVAAGSGVWNVPPAVRPRVLFPGLLEQALKAKSPDASVATIIVVDGPEKASGPLLAALRSAAPTAVRPDVVVLEFSCSPPGVPLGAEARAKKAVQSLLDLCRNSGVEALALAVPPIPDDFRRVDYAKALFDPSVEAKTPAINFAAFAAARGRNFEGEYYASADTLNVQGHAAAALLLQSILVNP